tara:strand:- start:237 stop:530 length:294 start_codon:yes stop_codon:yes gene_type:complete
LIGNKMDLQNLYNIIINEPLYLTIFSILVLILVYSILKKLFKMLVFILIILMFYIGYLIYTGQSLPNQKEINSVKDKVLEEVEKGINILDEISKNND